MQSDWLTLRFSPIRLRQAQPERGCEVLSSARPEPVEGLARGLTQSGFDRLSLSGVVKSFRPLALSLSKGWVAV